jgi:hypothetical protein
VRRVLFALVAAAAIAAPAHAADHATGAFVTRSGTQLVLQGRPFRFGGANIEWLGLTGYGPADPAGPHYPSHFEIDDALSTARELGANVVRSQTMGDSVGCPVCIEPELGTFNPAAFERIDYALRSAGARGIKIIPTIVGDDAQRGGGGCVYLGWRGIDVPNCSLNSMEPFWTDENVIGDVEQHIAAVLNHVNVYTHVAYKNDPTILGWDLLNGGGSPPTWTRRIAGFVRTIDHRHLILSGPVNARLKDVDLCVNFVYPHWGQPLSSVRPLIAQCKRAHKPFAAYEYGWDRTNFPTLASFRSFLATLRADPEIVGDAFWALEAHADGHGWLPIPADTSDPAEAARVESGQWWALYYPGVSTLVTTARDMRARALAIRAHNYARRGLAVPPHALPPVPVVTSTDGGHVDWRGAVGAATYTVERSPSAGGPWTAICRRCATDAMDGFADPSAGPARAWYRVTAYNLDGRAGRPSKPVR